MTLRGVHATAIIGGPAQHFDGVESEYEVVLGEDVRIGPYTTVDRGTVRNTVVGDRTYIMGHGNVGHDVVIGEDCEISDSVVVGGHATIGARVRIGFGTMILPYRTIGDGAQVGAGSVVTKDVPAGEVWCGNPARCLHKVNPVPFSLRAEVAPW